MNDIYLAIIISLYLNTLNVKLFARVSINKFYKINQAYSFTLWLKITKSYSAHCCLLGSCISFVMKSAEGVDFKLISPTQRTPFIWDAQRAETSTKMLVDKRSPSSSANNIDKTIPAAVVVIALV